jgi:hypothetical protein
MLAAVKGIGPAEAEVAGVVAANSIGLLPWALL